MVNDAPENSLMREVDTIKSCQDKMRQTLEEVGFESHYVLIGQYSKVLNKRVDQISMKAVNRW